MSSSTSRLTDEEKARVLFLLSDITDNGKYVKKQLSKPIDFKNAFKFNEMEKSNLKTINNKLKTFHEICDDADLEGKSSSEENQTVLDEEVEEDNNNHEWGDCRKAKNEQCRQIDNELDKLKEDTAESEGQTILCNDE